MACAPQVVQRSIFADGTRLQVKQVAQGMVRGSWWLRVAVALALGATRGTALPHYLLQRGCAKGLALVNTSGPLPAIMTAVPEVDPGILAVLHTASSPATRVRERTGGAIASFFSGISSPVPPPAVARGDAVPRGATLEVMYNGSYAGHATHIAFVVDKGDLVGGVPCGPFNGASMHCTTCGDDEGWIKATRWRVPFTRGEATVAAAVAHSGLGTPAVRLARFTVVVT